MFTVRARDASVYVCVSVSLQCWIVIGWMSRGVEESDWFAAAANVGTDPLGLRNCKEFWEGALEVRIGGVKSG